MEFTTKAESLIAAKEVKELYYQPQQIRKLEQLDQWNDSLRPYGMDLNGCVKWCLEQLQSRKDQESSPIVDELTSEWIDFKFNDPNKSLRPDTLRQIRSFGNMIGRDFKDHHIKEVGRQNIGSVLSKKTKANWSKIYRKNYLRYLRSFMRCCLNHRQLIDKDPTQGLQITLDIKEVDVLTISEVEKVCRTILGPNHAEIRPFLAIGLFSGIRSKELSKLTWNDVDLDHEHIVVSSEISKTRKGRLVPILPVLKDLIRTVDPSQPLIPSNFRSLLRKLKEHCPESLRQNVRRHSFATYYLSQFKSCAELAEIMGNSETIIRSHYVRMMCKRDADRFWKMTPEYLGLSDQ